MMTIIFHNKHTIIIRICTGWLFQLWVHKIKGTTLRGDANFELTWEVNSQGQVIVLFSRSLTILTIQNRHRNQFYVSWVQREIRKVEWKLVWPWCWRWKSTVIVFLEISDRNVVCTMDTTRDEKGHTIRMCWWWNWRWENFPEQSNIMTTGTKRNRYRGTYWEVTDERQGISSQITKVPVD